MIIYQNEIDDGLTDKLIAAESVAMASEAIIVNDKSEIVLPNALKSIAAIDDKDLFYVRSILVSSSWNKNDDIFDKAEVWAARHTPEDKPTNIEHDEHEIVGHITSNYPITVDGEIIPEDTDLENIPTKFHIVTGSVIYKGYSSKSLAERAQKLISEIENGTKYVSMECYFKSFDYGIEDVSTGEYKVLERNEDTSHLTKHLRAYGGTGEKDNYRIGRVLKDITFSGKGFVDKPANEDSIIFTKDVFAKIYQEQKNDKFNFLGVSNHKSISSVEKDNMNEQKEHEDLSVKAAELEQKVSELENANNTLNASISDLTKEHEVAMSSAEVKHAEELESVKAEYNSKIEKLEKSISELEATISEKTEAQTSLEEMKASQEATLAELLKEKEDMQAQIDTLSETVAEYKQKEEEMKKKEKMQKRMASLTESGIDHEEAEAFITKFENLDDDAFEAMSALIAKKNEDMAKKEATMKKEEEMAKKEAMMKKEEEMAKKEASAEESSDEELLDDVEVDTSAAVSVGGEIIDEGESTRAALVDFVRSRLGKK